MFFFLIFSCDHEENVEGEILIKSRIEEGINSLDTNDVEYKVLLSDSIIDYLIKRDIFTQSATQNIFIEDLYLNTGEIKLTQDILQDSLFYLNQYCTSFDLVIQMENQELLIASASMLNENPCKLIVKYSKNIGIYKTGKLYAIIKYSKQLNTKRFFTWKLYFNARYSFDGN